MASGKRSHKELSSCKESLDRLSFSTLGHMELEALDMLNESIGYFEPKETEKTIFTGDKFEGKLKCSKLYQTPEKQAIGTVKENYQPKLNSGYILFDGVEIKYVSNDASLKEAPKSGHEREGSLQSRESSLTYVSDLPAFWNTSYVDLLGGDIAIKSAIPRISLTPYKRLPQYAHFSAIQKCYLFATGLAPVLSVNAFFISVAFFLPLLGKEALSLIGICHNVPFLAAMILIFCGKKRWVPFFPTVPICLVFMAASVTVIPSLAAAGSMVTDYAIYGIVTLNGLFAGFGQSLTSRMVVLFPGGKSSSLIGYGANFGKLLPALVQITLVLSSSLNSHYSELVERNTLFLYVLFGVVFIGISLGLVSLILLRKSGIYELFAGKDCAAYSPKNITLGSVPETAARRYHTIKWHLFSQFAISLVSYYVLSLVTLIHEATLENPSSNASPFWRMYLATVLVGLFQGGNFVGEILSSLCCHGNKLQSRATKFLYPMASILRLGFVAAAVYFIHQPFLVYNNLLMMALYSLLALTSGFLSVAITSSCQAKIKTQRRDACPVVTQLLWLSGQVGVTIGIALSFVQYAV